MRIRASLGAALLMVALPAGAGDTLAMRVSPAFSHKPAHLTIQLSQSVLLGTRGTERAMVNQTVTVLGAGGR